MCGPSSQEKELQGETSDFANLLKQNYGTLFSEQQGVLSKLNAAWSPIVAAGPSQHGMSGGELSALNTEAINAAGAASASAQQAARTFGAGQGGGGTSGLTSGIQKQVQGAIAAQEAGKLASTQTAIAKADYDIGRENYNRAVQEGFQSAAGYNPNAAASEAGGEFGQSFQMANQINQENNALGKDIAGFATAAVGSAGDIYKAFKSTPAGQSTSG